MRRPSLFAGCVVLSLEVLSCGPLPNAPAEPTKGATASLAALDGVDTASLNGCGRPDTTSRRDHDIPCRFRAFARAFDAEREALGAPGAAVAIIEHGRVTFTRGFGTKGPNSTEAVRPTTLFRIGSMTKALTATALLTLVDEHRLTLDAKLKDVVPDIALSEPELSSLTVRQLLSHQSGLADNNEMDGPRDDAALSSVSTSEAFRASEYFMNPPGAFWNYSNPNFALAGLVTERVAGEWYRDAMVDRVFRPLHMSRTFFLGSDVVADGDYALGKSTDPSGAPWEVGPDAYENSWMRPAGFAYSSVLDYANFVRWLDSGRPRVLSPRLHAAMQRMEVPTLDHGAEEGYGLGLMVSEGLQLDARGYYRTPVVTHGGAIPGFASEFYLLPESGFGIVTLADTDGAYFRASVALAMRTFGELPEPTALPADWAVDPTTFPSLAGIYVDPHLIGPAIITVSGEVVRISLPGFDAAGIAYEPVLTPVTANNFIVDTALYGKALITFIKDERGAYTWLRTRLAVATRQPGTSAFQAAGGSMPMTPVDSATLREKLRRAAQTPEPTSFRLLPR